MGIPPTVVFSASGARHNPGVGIIVARMPFVHLFLEDAHGYSVTPQPVPMPAR